MKTRLLAMVAVMALSGTAGAFTLYPGQANPYQQAIECNPPAPVTPPYTPYNPYNPYTPTQPPVYTPPVYTPPQPPVYTPPQPRMVPVLVGKYRQTYNQACIDHADGKDLGNLGKYVENCDPVIKIDGDATSCDQTRNEVDTVNQQCLSKVLDIAKAKGWGAPNSGQLHAMQKGCKEVVSDCYVLRPEHHDHGDWRDGGDRGGWGRR